MKNVTVMEHCRVYKINFMGVVVSHGTLPGYRMKNVTVMVHCRVTG